MNLEDRPEVTQIKIVWNSRVIPAAKGWDINIKHKETTKETDHNKNNREIP